MQNIKYYFYILLAVIVLNSCSPPQGNFAGSEYMPDMGHSIAYEANVNTNYYYNTWDSASTITYKEASKIRTPVVGTVPRGIGNRAMDAEPMQTIQKGAMGRAEASVIPGADGASIVPYYYGDSEDERNRAIAEIIENPYPITEDGLTRGKELYNTFCGICHGEKGDGLGYLVREADPAKGISEGKYPAAPANFLIDPHNTASNGRYYHAIMYGKNVMGAYKDKISYEERWQVIHYIRSLQAKDQKLAYNETENTFNSEFGMPGALMKIMKEENEASHKEEGHEGDDHHSDEAHGEHGEDHSSEEGHSSGH